jgi:uncharacterized protein (DUF58 family)
VTRAGAVAVGGLALTLAGFTFDATELFVPGIAFVALGLATPAWIRLAARGATVQRRLHAERVVEDEPLEATIEVTRGAWGLPGGALLDPLAARPVALSGWLSLIGGGRTANVRVVARFSRRGRVNVEPPFLIVRDPLDLARARQDGAGDAQHVLVLPRTAPVDWIGRDLARLDASQGHAPAEPQAAADVDGLRPYRPGTPASRIHWPALARGAGLLERRMRADGDTLPLVVLDARCSGEAEHLDAAVRAAASLVLELARRSGCGLLLPGERRPLEIDAGLAAWPAVHTRLALVEAATQAQAPNLAAGMRQGRVFYIAAQPVERLPATLMHGGRYAGVLVLPAALGSRMPHAASFEVTGCRGYVLAGRHHARDRTPVRAA